MDQLGENKKHSSTVVDLGTEQYHLYKVIGEGTYSKVYLAIKKINGQYNQHVACKVIKKRTAGSQYVDKFLPRELNILRAISHRNIISVFNVVDINNSVYIFMNYCKRGDMLEYISTKGALSERRTMYFFRQIVSALHYLHNMDIAHRDLKCENVFLNSKNHIKIGDFGFARLCHDENTGEEIYSRTFCGSVAYAAPEIIQGLSYDPKAYDIWSIGCILYIMLSAQMPFDDSNVVRMVQTQQNRTICCTICYDMHISSDLKRLLVDLLEPDVFKRATIGQVVNAKWFTSKNDIANNQHIQYTAYNTMHHRLL